MKRQGHGRFVFTTSGRAMRLKDSVAGMAAYNAGKMGAFGLMLVVAAEGAAQGIRANAISPVAETRMLQRKARAGELAPELVTPAVLYLSCARCDISGMVVTASGGKSARFRGSRAPNLPSLAKRDNQHEVCRRGVTRAR